MLQTMPDPCPSFPPLFPPPSNNLWWSQCPPCHLFPRFVSPQFVVEPPLSSSVFSPWQNFPSKFCPPPSSICGRIPPRIVSPPVRRCILSCMTLPRPPQWRYECFSDAINTHSSGKAGPKIFSRRIPEIFPVLTPLPGAAGATSKPDFSSSNFHRPPSSSCAIFLCGVLWLSQPNCEGPSVKIFLPSIHTWEGVMRIL